MDNVSKPTAYYHLPGLFEFYELYRVFLPLFREHREYFYDWCEIGSIYGAPADCLWGGGRVGFGDNDPGEVLALMREYKISARLTFSNSLLRNSSAGISFTLCRIFGLTSSSDGWVSSLSRKKTRLNFYATNAAGSIAETGSSATKMSAAGISGKTARIITANLPAQRKDICFLRQ